MVVIHNCEPPIAISGSLLESSPDLATYRLVRASKFFFEDPLKILELF